MVDDHDLEGAQVSRLAGARPSEHLTQLVGRRAAAHGVAADESPGERPDRRQGSRPVVELFDADVDMSRPSRHPALVEMAVNVHAALRDDSQWDVLSSNGGSPSKYNVL